MSSLLAVVFVLYGVLDFSTAMPAMMGTGLRATMTVGLNSVNAVNVAAQFAANSPLGTAVPALKLAATGLDA